MKEKIKVIGFDADDTLWVNEPYYREIEKTFTQLSDLDDHELEDVGLARGDIPQVSGRRAN